MFSVILLTIAGLLLEAGAAYCLYLIIARQVPGLLYRILLTWVFWQVLNTLAALATWFAFRDDFTLLYFYMLFIGFVSPFVVWILVGKRRAPSLSLKETEVLSGGEKSFLYSFGFLSIILLAATLRHGFMPMWGNVDMANQCSTINAFHAKMLPNWEHTVPHVVQASPALAQSVRNWGYSFGYNFLVALFSRLTFIETIYVLNISSCLNLALWLSAPLLFVEWKKTKVWTVLYWVGIVFGTSQWYSAVERGWLTSIYSIGQCLIVLACIFHMVKHREKSGALLYTGIGLGAFMVANAHPYNYPIFFLSVLLVAVFSGNFRFGRRILRAVLYGVISLIGLLPLYMETAFKIIFDRAFGFITQGNLAGLLTIRNFEMQTSVAAPMWLGIAGILAGLVVVLLLVRSVKKVYIVGISAVATVVLLYAVYGSGGYIYQKAVLIAPPLFLLFGLHLVHDIWQLAYNKWLKSRSKTGKIEMYVVAPLLIAAMLLTGQISINRGIANMQDQFLDVKPMIEPEYYRAAKLIGDNIAKEGNRNPVNFRTLDGARKMFLARIVRQDDLAQWVPGLDYYAVEPTSYEKLIQYVDMAPDGRRPAWEAGMYLVHDARERDWPGFDTLSRLMADVAPVYEENDIAVTRMRLHPGVESAHIPLAGGVVPVPIQRTNARTRFLEDFGQGTMASTAEAPAVLGMDNPLSDTGGDLLFLFNGMVRSPGRVTLTIKDAYGQEITHAILPAMDGLTTVVIPRDDMDRDAARFELVMDTGDVPASVILQWLRVYAIPDGQ